MSTTFHRRLVALEAKIKPKISPHELHLLQIPAFVRLLGEQGVSVETFQRDGLDALPRDLLRALVDRLKASMLAAG